MKSNAMVRVILVTMLFWACSDAKTGDGEGTDAGTGEGTSQQDTLSSSSDIASTEGDGQSTEGSDDVGVSEDDATVPDAGASEDDAMVVDAGASEDDAMVADAGASEDDATVADVGASEDDAMVVDAGTADDDAMAADTVPSPSDAAPQDTSVSIDDATGLADTGPADAGPANADAETGVDAEPVDLGPPPVGTDDWYMSFGGAGAEEIKAVTADSLGNVYVTGYFKEPIIIGTESFTPVAETGEPTKDTFVASFDPEGGFRWAYAFGAVGADEPFEIAIDGLDNVYVAGAHKNDLQVGSELLLAKGSQDTFVVSYDSEGNQLWAKNWGGENSETPRYLSVNPSGDVFITGRYDGVMEADGISTPPAIGGDIFVLAVDGATHDAMWIQTFSGQGTDTGTAIVADLSRYAVIAVSYNQDLTVDADAGLVLHSDGNWNAGLVRLDDEGEVIWANEYGGTGAEEIIGLDMDLEGNIYATGVFSESASFGGADLVGQGSHDVMLASYKDDGSHLWSVGYGGEGFDQPLDLEVKGDGIYLTGRYQYDLMLAGNPLLAMGSESCVADCGGFCGDGLCQGEESFAQCSADCAEGCGDGSCEGAETSVTCSPDCGSVCGDGACNGTETGSPLGCLEDCDTSCGDGACGGSFDMVVGHFSTADGAPIWVQSVGSAEDDQANGIGVGGDGGIFVGGYAMGTVNFGGVDNVLSGADADSCLFRMQE